jgi:ABC-type sugar transport system, ATPase component
VAENLRIMHPALSGFAWRRKAGALIAGKLAEIFPGHGISPGAIVGDLSIARRQMVEVARAFTVTEEPLKLVILDEPTSSLDSSAAGQLLDSSAGPWHGASCILISHLWARFSAPRTGWWSCATARSSMPGRPANSPATPWSAPWAASPRRRPWASPSPPSARRQPAGARKAGGPERGARAHAFRGEVVGLAGLSGHGQTDLLVAW